MYFVLIVSSLFGQQLKLSSGAEVGVININQEYLMGVEFNFLYELNSNFDIGTSCGVSLTSLEGKLGKNSGIISNLGILVNYYPFLTNTRPFLGLGILYNINLLKSSGNNPYGTSNIHNAIGFEILIGLQNKLKEYLKLNLGFKYKYQNPIYSFNSHDIIVVQNYDENFEISSLNLFISLKFNL